MPLEFREFHVPFFQKEGIFAQSYPFWFHDIVILKHVSPLSDTYDQSVHDVLLQFY